MGKGQMMMMMKERNQEMGLFERGPDCDCMKRSSRERACDVFVVAVVFAIVFAIVLHVGRNKKPLLLQALD